MEDPLRAGTDDGVTLPELVLIETLGWNGTALPRLPLHLARLDASAARLGWPCDVAAAKTALRQATGPNPARLRLTLNRHGRLAVTVSALPKPRGPWRIALAAQPLDSHDPWLRVKSSHRAAYDQARAALPDGIDELIFQNERGEVCDGTITTLFFDAGQGLATPPLASGLLPGVLRAELLANGTCREALLPARDLPHVRLWVGNSLRGLIPAVRSQPRG